MLRSSSVLLLPPANFTQSYLKSYQGGFMWKLVFCLSLACLLQAAIFGRIQGIVHNPQHRPVAGATIKLQAITSDYSQTAQANDNGEFSFTSVPVGDYKIIVTQSNFETSAQTVTVDSRSVPVLLF